MEEDVVEIRVEGKTFTVPSIRVHGKTVIFTGKWLKMAGVLDEGLVEGEAVAEPGAFVTALMSRRPRPDLFVFAQKFCENTPKHNYHMEWDNAAVIPLKDYTDWWEGRLSQDTRRNVRRASKMGVTVQKVPFDDELVKGIVDIYDETPVRQGKPFWHFHKGFEVVKREAGTYLDRSEFLGAYHGDGLIGFMKLTYAGDCAHIIHILSKEAHADKRPTNALVAKAVDTCVGRGLRFLTYCKYIDGGNEKSLLTEFKRRNGFEKVCYPRYYVPLTMKGRMALSLGIHRGLRNLLPKNLVPVLLELRGWFFTNAHRKQFQSDGSAGGLRDREGKVNLGCSDAGP